MGIGENGLHQGQHSSRKELPLVNLICRDFLGAGAVNCEFAGAGVQFVLLRRYQDLWVNEFCATGAV